jgi:uncharacterized protein involved in exopolysaccharide biosynthesis
MDTKKNILTGKPRGSAPDGDDEIDLIVLVKTLWNGRKTVIWCVLVFIAIGLFVALTSPTVYTASTIMVPQVQSKSGNLGSLGGIAAMAGINLNEMSSSSQDLSPVLYPEIVKSYPFQKEIIYAPLKWNSFDTPLSLVEYSEKYRKPSLLSLVKKYTIGLPRVVRSLFVKKKENEEIVKTVNDSLFPITAHEKDLCDALLRTLSLKVDTKSGYLVLSAMGPEPLMTAQLADKARQVLQARITEYRIHKAQQNLTFIQERYNEKKRDFEEAQDRFARFRDRNLNMASNMAKIEEVRLQSEYQLAFTVYSELAKQLETSKIKVKEDTPVFSIIQPVTVPVDRTKPKKVRILGLSIIFGGLLGLGLVYLRQYLKSVGVKWKNI